MPDDLPDLNSILHSGALAYGKWGKMFEQSIQEFIGCEQPVLTVNSFTAAIHVLLSTLDIKGDDEIIASPQCCMASTAPIISYGAKVVWADIDPQRGTLCPESVEKMITARTKVIMHNHHCSYPGYIDDINAIGKKYGIFVVDDGIESFGSKYKGKYIGNVDTDATLFSFQTVRLPNTIDGGGIIFKDKSLYERAIRVRDLGVNRNTFRDSLGEINPLSDVDLKGYGVTMNEISSYIGFCQMNEISELIDKQRENAKKWNLIIKSKYPQIKTINTDDTEPSYWVFGLLSDQKSEDLRFFKGQGFAISGVHIPNTYYSIFSKQSELVGVREFYNRFLALPCGWWYSL